MTDRSPASLPSESAPDTADEAAAFRRLALPSMLWRPAYLAPSAWIEHLPFAFWIIEAMRPRVVVELGSHYGVSYFGFCEAIKRLRLDARTYAVDTWKGDEHSGQYGPPVYEQVSAYNSAHYAAFSRLVRSTFDEALEHFSDASVDLLHIDGLHTYEAVRHDFESWLPKLSQRAIVLMHDTNVRERGFGVFKLFEALAERSACFEFVHGHGLGIVAVGPDQPESVRELLAANTQPALRLLVRDAFCGLGRTCADARDLAGLQAEIRARAEREAAERAKRKPIAGWWQSPEIWRHINGLLGEAGSAAASAGFHRQIVATAGRPLARALSVGAGVGIQPVRLVLDGHVGSFELWSASEATVTAGRADAARLGVADRVTWYQGDGLSAVTARDYDLVYWNGTLHNQPDVEAAIAWSLDRLTKGGCFAADAYVGPSRFQYPDAVLSAATRFRQSLPERLLRARSAKPVPSAIVRVPLQNMIAKRPDVVPDSGRILDAVHQRMPTATVVATGGAIYQVGLADVLFNLEGAADAWVIERALLLDRVLLDLGHSLYAVIVGLKG